MTCPHLDDADPDPVPALTLGCQDGMEMDVPGNIIPVLR